MTDYTWSKHGTDSSELPDMWIKLESEPEIVGGDIRYLDFTYSMDEEGASEHLMRATWLRQDLQTASYHLEHPEFEDERDTVTSDGDYRGTVEVDPEAYNPAEVEECAAVLIEAALEEDISPVDSGRTLLEAD